MKHPVLLFTLLSGIAAEMIFGAAAQSTPPPLPQISLSGSAEVRVAPDEIILNVAVETRAETLEPARVENDQKINACLAFLKDHQLKERDFKTDHISIQPHYNYRDNANVSYVKPVGYIVRKNLEVRLTDVALLQTVLTGLITNGVNYVNQVDFRTTELRKHRDQARKMAVRAAKEKAEALTGELGAKLGKVLSITAHDNGGIYGGARLSGYNGYNNISMQNSAIAVGPSGGASDNAVDAFAVGQISVVAAVNVSFLIE
jgi:uncharacterized protein YggE